jgi:hypothetical protein
MAGYDLPTTLTVDGAELPIRSDFRAVLDVITVLGDEALTDSQRGTMALEILYEDAGAIRTREAAQEAVERLLWFVGGGGGEQGGKPKGRKRRLMDWEQDFPLIVGPVNRVLGYECRSCEYLHWWTFLSAYYEIGDCLFAQVVGIRAKRQKGKKLDKQDQAFYRDHRDLVDFRRKVTPEESALLEEWTRR